MHRFDPAQPLDRTPPFVRWTLAVGCALRRHDDYFDPERTERLLRGVRCYSEALAEGLVRSGVVLQRGAIDEDSLGFAVDAVFKPFGGQSAVGVACSQCPANAVQNRETSGFAECFGNIVPPLTEQFQTDLEHLFHHLTVLGEIFQSPRPHWNLLWIKARPDDSEIIGLRTAIKCIVNAYGHEIDGVGMFLDALDRAIADKLPLVVRAYPGGRCEGRRWYVEAHCDRCKAAWPEAKRQQCRVCGHVGGRQGERRRMRIGSRPYRPLREFLTPEEIARIVG